MLYLVLLLYFLLIVNSSHSSFPPLTPLAQTLANSVRKAIQSSRTDAPALAAFNPSTKALLSKYLAGAGVRSNL